jgi:hypothetical protein
VAPGAAHLLRRARAAADRPVRRLRDRLVPVPRAVVAGRGALAGGDVQVRRRRGARNYAAGGRQPGGRHARQGAEARARRRAGRGGPLLLLQPRLRLRGYRPRCLRTAHRRCRWWLHRHPAVHQGLHRRRRVLPVAQVQGGRPRGQDLQGEDEGRDPRELPQHDLLGPGGVRRPGGGAGVLQQGRGRSDGGGGRDARRRHPGPVALGPREEPRAFAGAVELRARRHGRAGMARSGRAGRADVPRAPGGPGEGQRRHPW